MNIYTTTNRFPSQVCAVDSTLVFSVQSLSVREGFVLFQEFLFVCVCVCVCVWTVAFTWLMRDFRLPEVTTRVENVITVHIIHSLTYCDVVYGWCLRIGDGVVDVMTRLWVRLSGVQFRAGARDFSLLQNVHTGCGAYPASSFSGYRGSLPWVRWSEDEVDHRPPFNAEVKNGSILLSQYAFMTWTETTLRLSLVRDVNAA